MARYRIGQLDAWTRKTKERMTAVIRSSTQDVIAASQTPKAKGGRMPIDTGNLRASLTSTLYGGTSLTGAESYVMTVASMDIGDRISFRWGAEYARVVNDGRNGRPGAHFVEYGVDQWSAIVRDNIDRAKAIVG